MFLLPFFKIELDIHGSFVVDLEEWKKEHEAEMDIEIPEKESLEIKTTMEYLVQKKDVKQIK
jgi:hypothetical protein